MLRLELSKYMPIYIHTYIHQLTLTYEGGGAASGGFEVYAHIHTYIHTSTNLDIRRRRRYVWHCRSIGSRNVAQGLHACNGTIQARHRGVVQRRRVNFSDPLPLCIQCVCVCMYECMLLTHVTCRNLIGPTTKSQL